MKIEIKNFKKLQDVNLSIPAEITGGNGTGKSTILEAISFVLTGKNLDGKEFEQIYDNRVDLHEAVADVSYFDNCGNEYRRIVSPVFQISRAGKEELKVKCNTICKKNDIALNDFFLEFTDFAKYGTDYFFNQKPEIQRSIFIDIMKERMPDYDVNSQSLKLKELKKSQKISVDEIKGLSKLQKETKDVDVPEISDELKKLNEEFLLLSKVDNSTDLSEINKRNNVAYKKYQDSKNGLTNKINSNNSEISNLKNAISSKKIEISGKEKLTFTASKPEDLTDLNKRIEKLNSEFSTLKFYENIGLYAYGNFDKNPVLVENKEKILTLESESSESEPTESLCPLNNEFCEVAKLHSISASVLALKSQNKAILDKEMNEVNSTYLTAKTNLESAEKTLSEAKERNSKLESKNKETETKFNVEKNQKITSLKNEIKKKESEILGFENANTTLQNELLLIVEPTPEILPEASEISEELKKANLQFNAENKIIIENSAINLNNKKNREKWESEIKIQQTKLFEIDQQIVKLTNEISEYFSNLDGIVKKEFSGNIEIGVQLLEYVISKDEYKDCFKITANSKVYPYECNGALQNNVKLQILANIQRLKNYTGITIMDNCEANTTDAINTCGLQCVLARATNESELIINN